VARRPRPGRQPRWGGAIAGWELTRLARRGTPTVARLLVALLLFAALLVTYLAAFPREIEGLEPGAIQSRLSEFGQQFARALLLVQAAVVFVLTPLFVAGSIVEETERRTLEFLLATDLQAREIILGKLWPRLLLVFGVVLAGWPVLAITEVWGGVDVAFVAQGSLVILGELWAIAGVSAACAVGARTLRRALVRSYLWSAVLLVLPVFTCPCGTIAVLADPAGAYEEAFGDNARVLRGGAPYAPPSAGPSPEVVLATTLVVLGLNLFVQFLIGALGLRRAVFKLRHARYFYARMPWQQRPRKPAEWEEHPPIPQGSPLLWKEIHLSGQTARFVRMLNLVPWVVWLCVASVFMLVGFAAVMDASETSDMLGNMNGLVRWGGGLTVGLMALVVGLHAAGSVARERQQETLTDLLAVPRPRSRILGAKWVGSMLKARAIGFGALAIPLVGVIAEGLSYKAVAPMFAAAFAFLGCAASFGLWLSVRVPTVQRATGLWLLVVGLWVGGTFLAAEAAYLTDRIGRRTAFSYPPERPRPLVWDRVLNPVLSWSELTFRISDDPHDGFSYRTDEWADGVVVHAWDVWPSALGIGVYTVLAWVFFAAAARRFEREGRG
jgi:ABC-type transport system involved in multi-copper enzyme maturation permease subunit